jgi:uncharacterized membrane protein YkoI
MYQPSHPVRRQGRRLAGLAAAFVASFALLAAAPLPAEPGPSSHLRVAQASEKVSLAQATRMVQERTGGQVLRAETKRDKGRAVHRIRVLTEDGRVRTVHVDAETGRMY